MSEISRASSSSPSTMSVPALAAPSVRAPARPAAAAVARRAGRLGAGAVALAGLVTALGACTWLVLAAADRPSLLSPVTLRPLRSLIPFQPWLLAPLGGMLPHLTSSPIGLKNDLVIAIGVLFVAWIVTWIAAPSLPMRVVAPFVAAAQLVFVLGPPQPLTDIFNYIVYDRMALDGLNPYTRLPAAGRHDLAYDLSNWHHLRSPYGPLFTLLTEPLGLLSTQGAYWAWKIAVGAMALGVLGLVWWLAVRLGRSPQRAVVFAGLCPVTLAIGIGGFHNDLPAIACVLGAVGCMLQARDRMAAGAPDRAARWDAAAGAMVVLAAGIKPPFAIVAPLVVLGAQRRLAAAAGAAGASALVGAVTLFAFGGALPNIADQSRMITPLSGPNLLGLLAGHGGADAAIRSVARDVALGSVAVAAAAVAWRRRWALPAMAIVLFVAMLAVSWVMPWYLAWSLPFAAVALPRYLAPAAVAACLWLVVGGTPAQSRVLHRFGYYPSRTTVGMQNHRFVKSLVR